jgi:ribonuclease E
MSGAMEFHEWRTWSPIHPIAPCATPPDESGAVSMRSLALRALSLGAALSVGAAAIAQTPARTPDQPPRGGAEQGARRGDGQDRQQRRGGGGPLFRDIALSEQQQTRVREIQQRYAQERRQLVQGARPARPQGQPADGATRRPRPDSATRAQRRAEREQVRGKLQQLTDRQVADLRAVLTGAQQPTFDRNVAAMKQRVTERTGERGERRDRGPRGDREGRRGGGHGRGVGRGV